MNGHLAFVTVYLHGTIYKERVLLTLEGKIIKDKNEILTLFKDLWLSKKLSVIHCPWNQRGDELFPRGDKLADKTTSQVAF